MRLFDLFHRGATGGPAAVHARVVCGFWPVPANWWSRMAMRRMPVRPLPRTWSATGSSSLLIEDASLRDRIQKLWLAWTDEADADALTDFYELHTLVAQDWPK